MEEGKSVEKTDLATLLGGLSASLLRDALALEGLAKREGGPGDPDYEALLCISASLDRQAGEIKLVAKRLCGKCRMAEAVRMLSIGLPERAETRARPAPYRLKAGRPVVREPPGEYVTVPAPPECAAAD